MKATLTFNLPDDRSDHRLAVAAPELFAALAEIERVIRGRLKHGDLDDQTRSELEAIRSMIPDLDAIS